MEIGEETMVNSVEGVGGEEEEEEALKMVKIADFEVVRSNFYNLMLYILFNNIRQAPGVARQLTNRQRKINARVIA